MRKLEEDEYLELGLSGAKKLLSMMRESGYSFSRSGGKIVVKPSSKLTDDWRSAIRLLKPHILAVLISEDA